MKNYWLMAITAALVTGVLIGVLIGAAEKRSEREAARFETVFARCQQICPNGIAALDHGGDRCECK